MPVPKSVTIHLSPSFTAVIPAASRGCPVSGPETHTPCRIASASVPASFIQNSLDSRPYVKVYGKPAVEKWAEHNRCPENDKLCDEAVWFMQNMFLGPRSDMDQIAEAVRKIHAHASEIARA